MAEVVRLKCFGCGASLSADSRSFDTGYICPHCGVKNFTALSAEDYQKLLQKSLDSFDYSIHVKMGELQNEIDKALEEGDEKRALEQKQELIIWQIKAAPFMYKTDTHKKQAFDQMLYRWKREYLTPRGRDLRKRCEETEKNNDGLGFAKAMFSLQMYLAEDTPHLPESYDPKDTSYRTTEYSLNRFGDLNTEEKKKIMRSLGWKPETTKGEKLRCTNCGAILEYPESGKSSIVCPYCKGEVLIGTAYDALTSFTSSVSQKSSEVSQEISEEIEKLKGEGKFEDVREKIDDLKEKINKMKEEGSFKGMSFSVVFKTCPQCGGAVQVTSETDEVKSCPHCGYTKP
jgi:DNA-directed RNA polymerase subunit RPC12/RpoP